MLIMSSLRPLLGTILIGAVATLAPILPARAELISTAAAIEGSASQARAELSAFLGRAEVQAELEALGINSTEAAQRVASLTDAEVLQVRTRLAELPAGQSFAAAVGGVLVVTVTVLLFTDLLGYTDVYPFISPLPRRAGA